MFGTRLTSEEIAKRIGDTSQTCILITPGVDAIVAEALLEHAKRTGSKAHVVIDGTHHAERSGYGETGTWRTLMDSIELRVMRGTRLGLLVTDCGSWLFAPRAGKLDPRDEEGLSAVALGTMESEAAHALAARILDYPERSPQNEAIPPEGQGGRPPEDGAQEPRAQSEISLKDVEQAEKAIEEHPPRDYAREREITVYTAFIGYIELRLAGSSLATGARLKIPNELVERGLGEAELRNRINESVRIDLDEEVDTGVREINERLNAIRKLYTRQLGEPHGRIYRKRQKQELDRHCDDLEHEINRANTTLERKIDAAIRQQIDDLAETYSQQAAQGVEPKLTKDQIREKLLDAWEEAGEARPRKVTLEATFKDLTWDTLQEEGLRQRVLELFPDLKNSALYRELRASTPGT